MCIRDSHYTISLSLYHSMQRALLHKNTSWLFQEHHRNSKDNLKTLCLPLRDSCLSKTPVNTLVHNKPRENLPSAPYPQNNFSYSLSNLQTLISTPSQPPTPIALSLSLTISIFCLLYTSRCV